MGHATEIIEWLGSFGSLLSGLGVIWVAKTYRSQKMQEHQKLELQIQDRYQAVFNDGNRLFRIDQIKELIPVNDGLVANEKLVIFLLNAETFLEKLEQAVALSRQQQNPTMEAKLKKLTKASIEQVQQVSRHYGHEYQLEDRPLLLSLLNSFAGK